MKKVMAVLMLSFVLMLFSACDTNRFFDQSVSLPQAGWHKDSLATFSLDVEDTTSLYNFYITLRNNNDYPYRNFYLFLNTRLPNNNITRDTIELILADLQGKWLGKGFGALKDNQIEVRRNLRFPLVGNYVFAVEQAMRQKYLIGLEDVGIRIEYSD